MMNKYTNNTSSIPSLFLPPFFVFVLFSIEYASNNVGLEKRTAK